MLGLLLSTAVWAQQTLPPKSPRPRISSSANTGTAGPRGRVSGTAAAAAYVPLFSFAPSSGVGMTAACACTNPTGTKGEVLNFTRASNATCEKGATVTGIVNGDFVVCSTDQARVMPGGDGSGPVGLMHSSTRTNSCLRSQEFDLAPWNSAGGGGGPAPVVKANVGTAPDGTLTAEKIWFGACPVPLSSSATAQNTSVGAAADSVYIKGCIADADGGCTITASTLLADGGPQRLDGTAAIGIDGGHGVGNISSCVYSGGACTVCAYNAATWNRCITTGSAGGVYNGYGCINDNVSYSGATDTGVADILIWGAQHEVTTSPYTYVTSYIPTAGTAVTRATEVAYFNVATDAGSPVSIAATTRLNTSVTAALAVPVNWAQADDQNTRIGTLLSMLLSKFSCQTVVDGGSLLQTSTGSATSAPNTLGCEYTATDRNLCLNGTCENATPQSPINGVGLTRIYIGSLVSGGSSANNVIKNVCADTTATGCR